MEPRAPGQPGRPSGQALTRIAPQLGCHPDTVRRAKTETAVDRYMHAFEAGTLTADVFADRVRDLGDKARALRLGHAELGRTAAHATAPLPTVAEVEGTVTSAALSHFRW
jgi:hypothetical protein